MLDIWHENFSALVNECQSVWVNQSSFRTPSRFPSSLLWSSEVMWLIFSVMCVWSSLCSVHPNVSGAHGVCVTPRPPVGAAGALGHALHPTGWREWRNQTKSCSARRNPRSDCVWVTPRFISAYNTILSSACMEFYMFSPCPCPCSSGFSGFLLPPELMSEGGQATLNNVWRFSAILQKTLIRKKKSSLSAVC